MLFGAFQEAAIAVLLIAGQDGVNARVALLPLAGALLMAEEILLQGTSVDVERQAFVDMAFECPQDVRGDIFGLLPVLLIPFLKDGHRAAGDLDVQFDIVGEAR